MRRIGSSAIGLRQPELRQPGELGPRRSPAVAVKGDSALSHILEDVISENLSASVRD
ncbi:hypothetical protein QWM81_22735 [Streptomyces ficellus]|uniref:FXSXX-COOH protein n=1 Tax=Streptomyces ficellus TaxID=1977088 RepID=A0ABT7ZBC5_9ACTN|nr:hypothetical protein [Streptomyces ficellus]MDN3296810.1 hypothetical protein [Streptomyces ficellus]